MTIKFFDFCCNNGHRFEVSFPSLEEMNRQIEVGLVTCPECGSANVTKLPSAAHIAAKKTEEIRQRAMENFMAAVRKAGDSAEDVGERFVQESRDMKAGLAPERAIKGRCTAAQARELLEEGIPVLPLPESSGKTLN